MSSRDLGRRWASIAAVSPLLAALVLGGAMLMRAAPRQSAAYAQDPPGQGPIGPPWGFPGQGPGRMPFVTGAVAQIDRDNGLVAVASPFGGEPQVVRLTNDTRLYSQKPARAESLKVGEQVQVQGMPTAITANTVTIGQMPNLMPGGFGPGGPGRARQRGARAQQSMAFAAATGKVTSTSPLTVALNETVSVVLKVTSSTRLTRISTATLGDLKEGDQLMAAGEMGDEGVLAATTIGINMGMGMGGPGMMGPGMGGGFPAPGGPGGFPPGGPDAPPGGPGGESAGQ
ncbi:MAG: hypothetical protein IT208_14610 [Chthonomonadales bacterium]|nr:hypothetical protein [Chthonomonadales bacterium]